MLCIFAIATAPFLSQISHNSEDKCCGTVYAEDDIVYSDEGLVVVGKAELINEFKGQKRQRHEQKRIIAIGCCEIQAHKRQKHPRTAAAWTLKAGYTVKKAGNIKAGIAPQQQICHYDYTGDQYSFEAAFIEP